MMMNTVDEQIYGHNSPKLWSDFYVQNLEISTKKRQLASDIVTIGKKNIRLTRLKNVCLPES